MYRCVSVPGPGPDRSEVTGMSSLVLHDYVTQKGGAERVAALLAKQFGEGALTTSAYLPESSHDVMRELRITELAPRAPDAVKASRALLAPIAAMAFVKYRPEAESIICSSSGWAHWITTDSPTLVYCYTPPRWLWVPDDYFADLSAPARRAVIAALSPLRRVDVRKAHARTRYIGISTVVQQRIQATYGCDADVVFPPVTLDVNGPQTPVDALEPGFFVLIARPRGYKNTEAVVRLFESRHLGTLVIVGGEKDDRATGRVRRVGRVSEESLRWLYQHCAAVLALSREDFGLTPVEGHMYGKPTIALRAGGYLDTCLEGVNAVFVDSADPADLEDAVREFARNSFDPDRVRETATRFSEETFTAAIAAAIRDIRR
jgi:glycosyltransferase involved in cell wall biosynthesis